ncbi:MAG: hypothetical protein Q8M65_04300, partial [Rhodoglobus sp.]|nr:hypothetical protein [Rhodoglobus sp.]
LGQTIGFHILRLVLTYGFIIGVLIILLGFGLKYRELSKAEQRRVISLLAGELVSNLGVVDELKQNTTSLQGYANVMASIIRIEKIPVLAILFPSENIDSKFPDDRKSNLYQSAYERLVASELLSNTNEMRRYSEARAAILRSSSRVKATVNSLADRNSARYQIRDTVYTANLPILRKIALADLDGLSILYSRVADARLTYYRVADSAVEYIAAIAAFCEDPVPTREGLSSVLAVERLTYSLLPSQIEKFQNTYEALKTQIEKLDGSQARVVSERPE